MITTQKRMRVANLRLNEISSVDRPAQTGAVAVLLKRADGESNADFVAIVKSAQAVERGEQPTYSESQYEAAMLDHAEQLARDNRTTPEQALARGLSTDRMMRSLARGVEVARVRERAQVMQARYGTSA